MARAHLRPRCLSPNTLASSILPWTLGNVQVPLPKGGQLIYNSRCCPSKVTFNYGLMIPHFPPSEALWRHQQAPQVAQMMLNRLHLARLVSIFARAPVCPDMCRYCRVKPCDVAIAHDDHTCYDCEQRLLHPEGAPGSDWQPPQLPVCDSWCHLCSTQRCALRDVHDLHLCMRCEHRPAADPAPAGGGDPWAAVEDEKA